MVTTLLIGLIIIFFCVFGILGLIQGNSKSNLNELFKEEKRLSTLRNSYNSINDIIFKIKLIEVDLNEENEPLEKIQSELASVNILSKFESNKSKIENIVEYNVLRSDLIDVKLFFLQERPALTNYIKKCFKKSKSQNNLDWLKNFLKVLIINSPDEESKEFFRSKLLEAFSKINPAIRPQELQFDSQVKESKLQIKYYKKLSDSELSDLSSIAFLGSALFLNDFDGMIQSVSSNSVDAVDNSVDLVDVGGFLGLGLIGSLLEGVRQINLLDRGEINSSDALKNIAGNTLVRGTSSFFGVKAGAAIGTAILPGIGTIIGGTVGGFIGLFGANKAIKNWRVKELEDAISDYNMTIKKSKNHLSMAMKKLFKKFKMIISDQNEKLIELKKDFLIKIKPYSISYTSLAKSINIDINNINSGKTSISNNRKKKLLETYESLLISIQDNSIPNFALNYGSAVIKNGAFFNEMQSSIYNIKKEKSLILLGMSVWSDYFPSLKGHVINSINCKLRKHKDEYDEVKRDEDKKINHALKKVNRKKAQFK